MDVGNQEHEQLRGSLDKAFNIYQATLAMVAIFDGFAFAGLLQLLTSSDLINGWRLVSIYILTAAMLFLTTAAFCFHATAHRVIRYWNIFYPLSIFNKVGGMLFVAGVSLMLAAIGSLLFARNIIVAAVVLTFWALGLFVFGRNFRKLHEQTASYMVPVDPIAKTAPEKVEDEIDRN